MSVTWRDSVASFAGLGFANHEAFALISQVTVQKTMIDESRHGYKFGGVSLSSFVARNSGKLNAPKVGRDMRMPRPKLLN